MTTDGSGKPVRAEDDPLLDWHSDARRIMDEYANDVAYRQIAGTQIELLRRAHEVGPIGLPPEDAVRCFDDHLARTRAAGIADDVSGTVDDFVVFLAKRVMLRVGGNGRLVLTSVGRDFLRYVSDRDLPNPPL